MCVSLSLSAMMLTLVCVLCIIIVVLVIVVFFGVACHGYVELVAALRTEDCGGHLLWLQFRQSCFCCQLLLLFFGHQLLSSFPLMVDFFLPTVLRAFKGLSHVHVVGINRP